jgi:hypothetical protein
MQNSSGFLSRSSSTQELARRLQEVIDSNQAATASVITNNPIYVPVNFDNGTSDVDRSGRQAGAAYRDRLSDLSTPRSQPLRKSFQADFHSQILDAAARSVDSSQHQTTSELGRTPSSSSKSPWPRHKWSNTPQSGQTTPYGHAMGHAMGGSVTRAPDASGPTIPAAFSRAAVSSQNAAAFALDEPQPKPTQRDDASSDWVKELALKVPQKGDTSGAYSRKITSVKHASASLSSSAPERAAAGDALSPLEAYLRPHAEQSAHAFAPRHGQLVSQGASPVHDSQVIFDLKSQLLSCEGNLRVMQSTIDELRRQNFELAQAASQSKNAQLVDLLQQLAATTDELREMQQQHEDSLSAARTAEQTASQLQNRLDKIQQESINRDANHQSLEKACATSVLAAETATSKLKAAADECRRLERELEIVSVDTSRLKMQLQTQTARADEATAMWREAEADVRQCRHAMQLDADRLQVLFRRALCACVYCLLLHFSCKHDAVR